MKKFLSLVLALVMTMSLVTMSAGAKDFTDNSKITYKEAVSVVSSIGIVDGYEDGAFNPQNTLTRGAAAKIICNLILGPTTAGALSADSAPYKDVPVTNNFAGYIAYCQQQGIISGYADGTFRPGATLTGYAFMKMLLGALGYDAKIEGYEGANWSVAVGKQALGIGLDDGNDEFIGTKAVTREEACLYVFNTLQATMVEYDSKTSVNVNGAIVSIAGDKAKNVAQGSYDNNMHAPDLQFAERFFDKLKKAEETDSFARPATTWRFKGDKIGTFPNTPDKTYTKNVKLGDIYSDLNMSEKDPNAEVFYNGVESADVVVSRNNTVKIASTSANNGLVGDGSMVEVFYDDDNNAVTICIIDVYVGEISNVVKNVSDPYVVVAAHSDMVQKNNSTAVSFSGSKTHFETEESFSEEDIVLFTYSQKDEEIKSVKLAESVEGTVTKITSTKSVDLGDTNYKYAKNVSFAGVGGAEGDLSTKNDYVLYLDENNLVIYFTEQEFDPSDYAFVLNVETNSAATFGKDRAALVTAGGDLMTVDTDDDYTALKGQIVTYRADSNNKYVLRKAPNSSFNGTGTAADAVIPAAVNAATTDTGATTGFASNKDTGMAKNGSTTFSMKNGLSRITVNGYGTASPETVYSNSESVFVVATVDTAGRVTYQSYTGIKNAPTIASDDVNAGHTGAKVEMFYYTRSGGVLAFAFIDATNAYTTSGKSDVMFLAGKESVSKLITNSDNKQYYTYNAVVDGEITTVSVLADATGIAAGAKVNGVYTSVQRDSKDYVKSVSTSFSGYTELTGTGVWKLSGKYTIGLGGATASASARETVASDAKIYYVATDGEISKVDGISSVYSDATAKYIALRDDSDGDVSYLFIQEVDNGKEDNADTVYELAGLTVDSYTAPNAVVTLTGVNDGDTYTLTLSQINGGTTVKLRDIDVTANDGNGDGIATETVRVGTLAVGTTYMLSCGDKSDIIAP